MQKITERGIIGKKDLKKSTNYINITNRIKSLTLSFLS